MVRKWAGFDLLSTQTLISLKQRDTVLPSDQQVVQINFFKPDLLTISV